MFPPNAPFDTSATQPSWNIQAPQQIPPQVPVETEETEDDNSHRPPNAFILYSQAMRTQVRQDNPSLSNTECSRLLGKMWKEVPAEIKLQYKQKAAAMQEEFKAQHPNYTYRKARRKRALNELLTKSTQGVTPAMLMPGQMPDMGMWAMMQQNQQPMYQMPGQMSQDQLMAQMGQQPQQQMNFTMNFQQPQPNQQMFQMQAFPQK